MTIEEEFKLYADDYYKQHEFVGFDEECWEKEWPVRDIIWPVRQKYGRVDNEELLQPFPMMRLKFAIFRVSGCMMHQFFAQRLLMINLLSILIWRS